MGMMTLASSFRPLPPPWLIALLLTLAWGAAARAEVVLTMDAPAGCPGRSDLEAAIAARGARLDGNGPQRALHVRIEAEAEGFVGILSLPLSAEPALRRIHATSCAELVDALAAVAAIAVSHAPEAPQEVSPKRVSYEASDAVVAPSGLPRAADGAPVAAPGATALAHGSRHAPARDPGTLRSDGVLLGPFQRRRELSVEAGTLTIDRGFDLTLLGGAAIGVLPGQVVPRFDFIAIRTTMLTLPGDTGTFLSAPLLYSRLGVLGPALYTGADVETDLFGLSLGVGTCLALGYVRDGFSALLCGELGYGVVGLQTLDGSGNEEQSKTRGYGSVGGSALFQYGFGSRVHVTLRFGLDSTTHALSAQRADGSEVFHGARFLAADDDGFDGYGISGYVQLGIGVHF